MLGVIVDGNINTFSAIITDCFPVLFPNLFGPYYSETCHYLYRGVEGKKLSGRVSAFGKKIQPVKPNCIIIWSSATYNEEDTIVDDQHITHPSIHGNRVHYYKPVLMISLVKTSVSIINNALEWTKFRSYPSRPIWDTTMEGGFEKYDLCDIKPQLYQHEYNQK